MSFLDKLSGMLGRDSGGTAVEAPEDVGSHFEQVSASVPRESLAEGLGHAFRSNETPPFSQMVSRLYSQSNPQQRSGLLSTLLSSVGPAGLGQLGQTGGGLGTLVSAFQGGQITPAQAEQISPEHVEQLASHAEQQNPSVVEHVSGFFSQHPGVVKSLGTAALGIITAKMLQRR